MRAQRVALRAADGAGRPVATLRRRATATRTAARIGTARRVGREGRRGAAVVLRGVALAAQSSRWW